MADVVTLEKVLALHNLGRTESEIGKTLSFARTTVQSYKAVINFDQPTGDISELSKRVGWTETTVENLLSHVEIARAKYLLSIEQTEETARTIRLKLPIILTRNLIAGLNTWECSAVSGIEDRTVQFAVPELELLVLRSRYSSLETRLDEHVRLVGEFRTAMSQLRGLAYKLLTIPQITGEHEMNLYKEAAFTWIVYRWLNELDGHVSKDDLPLDPVTLISPNGEHTTVRMGARNFQASGAKPDGNIASDVATNINDAWRQMSEEKTYSRAMDETLSTYKRLKLSSETLGKALEVVHLHGGIN